MIDWTRVAELRADIGEEDFDEVVGLFLEEVDAAITTLRDGKPNATLEEDLHFLKGAALNLGFEAFTNLCSAGEKAAAAGHAGTVNLTEIIDCFEVSRAAFDTGLAQGAAA